MTSPQASRRLGMTKFVSGEECVKDAWLLRGFFLPKPGTAGPDEALQVAVGGDPIGTGQSQIDGLA